MLLPTLCLYLTLAACGLLIALAVVKYDLYEREPWPMILLAIALGAGGMWLAGQGQVAMIRALTGRLEITDPMLAAMAASTEELAKLAAVAFIALAFRRHFNEPLDGIVYGSFAGLGAAIEESIWVLGKLSAPEFLPPQEPVRLAGHLVMGGIGGFGLGMIVIRSRWWPAAVAASLVAAFLLHGVWDIAAFSATDHYRLTRKLLWWHTITPIGLMIAGMLAYRHLIARGAALARTHWAICDVRPPRRRIDEPVSGLG